MNLKRQIWTYYALYTVYAIMFVGTTDLPLSSVLPAVVLMWINYVAFSAGQALGRHGRRTGSVPEQASAWLTNRGRTPLLLIAAFSMMSSLLAVKYYTGQTPATVVRSLLGGESLYSEYQAYFRQHQRGVLTLNKVPFVLMLFYVKFILFYSYASFLSSERRISRYQALYLIVVTMSHVYVGVARGTSFEFFELTVLILFVMLSRRRPEKPLWVSPIQWTKVLMVGSLMILVFYTNLAARGGSFRFSLWRGAEYDPNGLLSIYGPPLAFLVLITSGYFGFGFFYLSAYVSRVWLASLDHFLAGMIPLGYRIVEARSIPEIMQSLVDMGPRWHPDTALIIDSVGYLGLLVLCFCMGVLVRILHISGDRSPMMYLTDFMVLLEMISLPVGNFVTTSSANRITVVLLVVHWSWRLLKRCRAVRA